MWEIKDKEHSLHQLEILFNCVGIKIDYETTMLIDKAYKLYNDKRGDTKLSDMMELKQKYNEIVNEYYKSKQDNERKND